MSSILARAAAGVAAVATLTVPTGCSGSSDHRADQTPTTTASSTAANHNDQDVAFLQNMIPHHEQALDLTAMVPGHTGNVALNELATTIANEQQPEIQAFRAQLMQWEISVAPGPGDAHLDGMVDAATMDKLQTLHGADFDTLWLHAMVDHHQDAITMADKEIKDGQSPDTISLARSMLAAQQAEIDQMNQMLGG